MTVSSEGPVYTINSWGMRVEHSKSSIEKTLAAVTNFLEKVSHSGLRISMSWPLQTQVLAGKKTTAYAYSDDTMFHVHYAPDDPEAVHYMHKRGNDENGLPRDFDDVVAASEPDLNTLAAWADPTKYPIQSSVDDFKADVIALLNQLDVGGSDRYLLESVRQEQLGKYKLPFYTFIFTTKSNMGDGGNQNRDEIDITVRVGGTDLQKGEAELVYFFDAGFVWRKLEAQAQSARNPTIPGIKPLNLD